MRASPLQTKSLDELEDTDWSAPDYGSFLVQRCHALRSVPIGEMSIEDLRLLIGQNIGLKFLIPIAMEKLEANPYAQGDYYPSDLLYVIVRSCQSEWPEPEKYRQRLKAVCRRVLANAENISPRLNKTLLKMIRDFVQST